MTVRTPYEASPACRECEHWLSFTRTSPTGGFFQHGENPEAILFVPCVSAIGPMPPNEVIRGMFREWVARVHMYEGAGTVEIAGDGLGDTFTGG